MDTFTPAPPLGHYIPTRTPTPPAFISVVATPSPNDIPCDVGVYAPETPGPPLAIWLLIACIFIFFSAMFDNGNGKK